MIPLYGFLDGDTIGLIVLAQPEDTMATLADKLQSAASVRVPRRQNVAVVHRHRTLDPESTVTQAGLAALDRFDVVAVRGT